MRLYAGSGDPYRGPHDYEASVFPIAPFPSQGEESKTQSTVLFHMHWLNYSWVPWGITSKLPEQKRLSFCSSRVPTPLLSSTWYSWAPHCLTWDWAAHRVQLETRVVTGSTESFLLSHASYSARLGCGTSFHQWDNTKATRFMSNYLESGSLGNVKARTL